MKRPRPSPVGRFPLCCPLSVYTFPSSIKRVTINQSVFISDVKADDTLAVDAVLVADKKRTALLEEVWNDACRTPNCFYSL